MSKIRITSFVFLGLIVLLLSFRFFQHGKITDGMSFSRAFYDDQQRLLRVTLSDDEKYRLWMPLEKISPALIEATLEKEDRHFYKHVGSNPVSLFRGFWQTYVKHRRAGGSTITMQLARIRYDLRSRSIGTKILQLFHATYLELRYSKKEILESYLNLVPYGRNIEGAGAASMIYFGKPALNLTKLEADQLTDIPPSPTKRSKRLVARGNLPFEAPHFVNGLIQSDVEGSYIQTTLNLKLQHLVERQIKRFVDRQKRVGIYNGAALLLDTRTMEIKASVGSSDFFNKNIDGQVDGTNAKRSPGSTLKSFIYALALDEGVLTSETMLKDSPMRFGGFNPENFDHQFSGPISAKLALTRSRNIPAVYVASQLTKPSFYEFLKNAGISNLQSEQHYGLSLVLGGGEVTMEELAMLYATLSNQGELKSIRKIRTSKIEKGIPILSPEASFIVKDMLRSTTRPDIHFQKDWLRSSPEVSWKTGTSYGFRDAWTAGIMGPYVLIVWLGNFDGQGNPAFVGVQSAAVLFFEILDAIHAEQSKTFANTTEYIPHGVKRVQVCAISGKILGPHCHKKKDTWFIPGKSPIEVCDIHREVRINPANGLQVCSGFNGATKTQVIEYWPSDLLKQFAIAGIPRQTPPRFDSTCSESKNNQGKPPKITSPLKGITYTAKLEVNENESIAFDAVIDADAYETYWFLDTTYLGKSSRGKPFFWKPVAGNYLVRVVDNLGRSDSIALKVSSIQ